MLSYGQLDASVADMTTHVYVGTMEWAVRGLWEPTLNGWKLGNKSIFLPVQ